MSEAPPPLDYASPAERPPSFDRDGSVGMLIVGFLLGVVFSALLIPSIAAAMNAVSYDWGLGGVVLLLGVTIAAEVSVVLLIDRRCVNRGLVPGLFLFYGVCLLLVGACFCLVFSTYR